MLTLFKQFLEHLGSPKDQKSEAVALTVVYSITLSFFIVMITVMLMIRWSGLNYRLTHPPSEALCQIGFKLQS